MRISTVVPVLLTVAAGLALGQGTASAQATRTWVSGVGDDANPCSRTAPCKTFAGAISKTAPGGVIDVLDPGGFGAVTITKAITIQSDSFVGGVLVSGTNGIVVNAGANDQVVLRGLSFEGLGTGLDAVKFLHGGSLTVENCNIHGFTQWGIDFEPSSSALLFVSDTVLRGLTSQSGGGVFLAPAANGSAVAVVEGVRLENDTVGLKAQGDTHASLTNCVVAGPGQGVAALSTNAPTNVLVDRTLISDGQIGVLAEGSWATVRLAHTTLSGNGVGMLNVKGGQIISAGDNNNFDTGAPTSTIPQQ
jgi:hypothetical protein